MCLSQSSAVKTHTTLPAVSQKADSTANPVHHITSPRVQMKRTQEVLHVTRFCSRVTCGGSVITGAPRAHTCSAASAHAQGCAVSQHPDTTHHTHISSGGQEGPWRSHQRQHRSCLEAGGSAFLITNTQRGQVAPSNLQRTASHSTPRFKPWLLCSIPSACVHAPRLTRKLWCGATRIHPAATKSQPQTS